MERKSEEEKGNETDRIDKREIKRVRFELDGLKEDFLEDLEDLQENFEDHIDDLREKREDIKEELVEELQELIDEKDYLLRDIDDAREEMENLGEGAIERIDDAKEKFLKLKSKKEKFLEKYLEKLKEKHEKAKKKAAKRINISVDEDTSDEWRDWSEELGSSVSELIRKSMKFVKDNIGDLSKLEELGENIERAVKESGIEDLAEKIESEVEGKMRKPKIKIDLSSSSSSDRDRIKKRVRGLIKLQKSLPIDKLAQALNRAKEDAENLIYELVDEGIEGTIEESVFKFTNAPDEVISKINELIDKM